MGDFSLGALKAGTVRFVDISDRPVEAEVLRNGVKVSKVEIREDLVQNFIAPENLDVRLDQPRIVFQSVAAGQRVARGTVVDIVLASRYLVGADFVRGAHPGLVARSVGEVGDLFLAAPDVEDAVRRAAAPEDLSATARAAIEATAAANNVAIDGTAPGQDFRALFTTIKAAQTFR